MNKYRDIFLLIFKKLVWSSGILLLVLLILSFTRIPFDVHRWLGSKNASFQFTPENIIMLGGSGMPSESNLIRLNYTKDLALFFPDARILISHPNDTSTLRQMVDFLQAFNIPASRIFTESHGTNTREQVYELISKYPGIVDQNLVIVTSPENMYRTLGTFRKLGFKKIGGVAAFENAMFIDLGYNHKKLGGRQYVPDVSRNMELRYNFWNYLKLEITCLREFAAILYYEVNGWI
jgi:uncharacterized SAM-binding protein YcdF (DUF218 family)